MGITSGGLLLGVQFPSVRRYQEFEAVVRTAQMLARQPRNWTELRAHVKKSQVCVCDSCVRVCVVRVYFACASCFVHSACCSVLSVVCVWFVNSVNSAPCSKDVHLFIFNGYERVLAAIWGIDSRSEWCVVQVDPEAYARMLEASHKVRACVRSNM